MPILYLVRGLPGARKSTLARKLVQTVFEVDDYFVHNGVYKFDATKLEVAHRQCQERANYAMYIGGPQPDIAVANTFSTRREMYPYIALAAANDYQLVVLTVSTVHTNQELAARSIHGVPESTIAAMRLRWEH